MVVKRKCPICDGAECEFLFDVDFSLGQIGNLPKKNVIVACNNCGFTFADNDADQSVYDEYYSHNNTYAYDDSVKGVIDEMPSIIKTIEDYADENDTIVDIGSGSGRLLSYLKEEGYSNLTGLDPDETSCLLLKEKGLGVIHQSIFDDFSNDMKGKFDVVISTCVAEHIFDLKKYIKQCLSLIKKAGCFVIEVPAVEGFEKHYSEFPNYFNHEHINYFSKTTLDRLLDFYGYKRINPDDVYSIQSNGEMFIIGVYEKGDDNRIYFCDKSKQSILNYYEEYKSRSELIRKRIASFILENDRVVLWGCGSFSIQFLSNNRWLLDHIEYAIDSNPAKRESDFCGKKVFDVDHLIAEPYPVLIFSMLNSEDCIKQLKEMDYTMDYVSLLMN